MCRMKRLFAGALTVVLLSACTNGVPPSSSLPGGVSSSGQTQQVELKFAYNAERATSMNPTVEEIYQTVDAFNAAQERIKVETVVQPGYGDFYSTKSNRLPVKTDLDWKTPRIPKAGEVEKYLPLNAYLFADVSWRRSFRSGFLDLCTYGANITKLPVTASVSCMFYNKELLVQAGITPETIITWDDFLTACETLKRAGIQPITLSAKDAWCIALLTNYLVQRIGGAGPVNAIAEGKTGATFEQSCFINAAEMTLELFEKGYIQATAPEDSNDAAAYAFREGEAAFFFMGSWAISSFYNEDSKIQGKVGALPFLEVPGGKGSRGDWMGKIDGISVYKDSKYTEESVTFLRWMTSDRVQEKIAESGVLPATNIRLDGLNVRPELIEIDAALKQNGGTIFPFFDEAFGNELGTEYNNSLNAIVVGAKTPEQAFADLQSFYQAQTAASSAG